MSARPGARKSPLLAASFRVGLVTARDSRAASARSMGRVWKLECRERGRHSESLEQADRDFRFHARDVNLVMDPALPHGVVRFRVRIDGRTPARDAGVDVDEDGRSTVVEQRLYQLIQQKRPNKTSTS